MKKTFVVLFVGLSLLLFATGNGAQAADLKVGVVDLFKVLNESDTGKRAKTDLEFLVKSKQGAIDEKGKSIEKLKADFDKQAAILSPEARKAKEEELERLVREYQRIVQDSQAEIKKKETELMGSILGEVRELVAKLAQEEDYTLVLENMSGVVLYFSKAVDITDKVVSRYNETKQQKPKTAPAPAKK